MTTTTEQPVAWALFNPATGKVDHRCYQREDAAKAGAAAHSSRWRTLVAVPLYIQAGEEFLEFKEALSDLRSLRAEHRDLNGGENRESNLAPILAGKPHREKTAQDVAERVKTDRMRAKHFGLFPKPKRRLQGRGFEKRAQS